MSESKTQNHQSLHLHYRADEYENNINQNAWGENRAESCIVFQVHFQHDSLVKSFSQPISLVHFQLPTDWEHTFHVCLRCRSWQQVLGKSQLASGANTVYLHGIRDPELKSPVNVFWVVLAVSKISNQFSVHSVWHSDLCNRRMFHHVMCQEPEALQWWLVARRLA